MTDHDVDQVSTWMEALQDEGVYVIDDRTKNVSKVFCRRFCDEKGTIKTIGDVYQEYDHVVDTHTAVGFNVYERYANAHRMTEYCFFVSTASPF